MFGEFVRLLKGVYCGINRAWILDPGRVRALSLSVASTLRALLLQLSRQPVETFEQTITGGSASGLDVPRALPQAGKAELIRNFGSVHGIRKILLVGEDEQEGVAELILVEHALEFFAGLDNTVAIVAVDYENDTLGVLEVMSPQRSDLVLTTDIPDGELNVLVLDGFDVEADGRDGRDDLTELELVENSGLSGSVETDHENSHLLLAEEPIEELSEYRERVAHFGGCVLGDAKVASVENYYGRLVLK